MRYRYPTALAFALTALIGFSSCSDSFTEVEDQESANGYADGTYCAEVDYYYSTTGTSSTYTLLVDVEDNRLVKIHWPNGGWLDESHYSGPDIEDGSASFTSDQGVDYTVRIQGEEGNCSTDSDAEGETALIEEHENQLEASASAETRRQEEEEEQQRARQEEEEQEQIRREEEERQREEAASEAEE